MRTLLIFIVLISAKSYACSCKYEHGIDEIEKKYTHIFVGTVISIDEYKNNLEKMSYSFYKVVFTVTTNIKGAPSDRFTVYTSASIGACGMKFEEGVEYAVFAYYTGPELARQGYSVDSKPLVTACSPSCKLRGESARSVEVERLLIELKARSNS